MAGLRTSVPSYDASKKLYWLESDCEGFFYTTLLVFIVMAIVVGGSYFLATHLSLLNLILLMMVVSVSISFAIVFCFRYNVILEGKQRRVRYFCRWL